MTIDVNVHLSRWPFRRLPCDETSRLNQKLRSLGIEEAWAGSFDGVLHRDLAGVNERVAEECRASDGLLRPVGTINPLLPDWREEVRRCHEQHGMRVIRLYPNYHGYRLDAPEFGELLNVAEQRKLVVQIPLKLEDERTHHPLMKIPAVDAGPLQNLMERHPQVRIMVLNHSGVLRDDRAAQLTTLGLVAFDVSHAEQVGALENLVKVIPPERLVFGSHAPFFNLESATFKFRESNLGAAVETAIRSGNARRILATP